MQRRRVAAQNLWRTGYSHIQWYMVHRDALTRESRDIGSRHRDRRQGLQCPSNISQKTPMGGRWRLWRVWVSESPTAFASTAFLGVLAHMHPMRNSKHGLPVATEKKYQIQKYQIQLSLPYRLGPIPVINIRNRRPPWNLHSMTQNWKAAAEAMKHFGQSPDSWGSVSHKTPRPSTPWNVSSSDEGSGERSTPKSSSDEGPSTSWSNSFQSQSCFKVYRFVETPGRNIVEMWHWHCYAVSSLMIRSTWRESRLSLKDLNTGDCHSMLFCKFKNQVWGMRRHSLKFIHLIIIWYFDSYRYLITAAT